METKPDVIIIDDDLISSKLAQSLLAEAGLKAAIIDDPADALSILRKKQPKAVIIDLMLNNLNGLEIVKLINSDALIKNIKVIVVTQKAYDFEKKQAFRYGIEGFIKKPYDVAGFAARIKQILSGRELPQVKEEPESEDLQMSDTQQPQKINLESGKVRITFWGYRSMPKKISNMPSYIGRQTPCVSIETQDDLVILDAGTGIIPLGKQIMENHSPKNMWMLLTHFHIGHIWGVTNFNPIFQKGYTVKIGGPAHSDKKFKQILTDIFYGSPFWESKNPKARVLMYEMGVDTYDLSKDIKVTAMQANHPSNTFCYKIEVFGKKIVYAPASEISGETVSTEQYDEKLSEFCHNSDFLIHDTAYTHDDYLLNTGTGHSSDRNVLEFAALKAKAKNLVMFNFDGKYADETVEMMIKKAQKTATEHNWHIKCHNIKEGYSVVI